MPVLVGRPSLAGKMVGGRGRPPHCGDARPTTRRPAPPSFFRTNLPSNGGTGFQPVQAQAEACGYQKLPYDCDLISVEQILSPQPVEGLQAALPPVFYGSRVFAVLDGPDNLAGPHHAHRLVD